MSARASAKDSPASGRRGCPFCNDGAVVIDYKDSGDAALLISDREDCAAPRVGRLRQTPARVFTAIKRARVIALLPFTTNY